MTAKRTTNTTVGERGGGAGAHARRRYSLSTTDTTHETQGPQTAGQPASQPAAEKSKARQPREEASRQGGRPSPSPPLSFPHAPLPLSLPPQIPRSRTSTRARVGASTASLCASRSSMDLRYSFSRLSLRASYCCVAHIKSSKSGEREKRKIERSVNIIVEIYSVLVACMTVHSCSRRFSLALSLFVCAAVVVVVLALTHRHNQFVFVKPVESRQQSCCMLSACETNTLPSLP